MAAFIVENDEREITIMCVDVADTNLSRNNKLPNTQELMACHKSYGKVKRLKQSDINSLRDV
jgi:hypothetical protein